MPQTNISVNERSVLELLSGAQNHRFVIPEYQRPYAWGKEEITTLFEDIWQFSLEQKKAKEEAAKLQKEGKTEEAKKAKEAAEYPYFLGNVVMYENSEEEWEVIDGQQRITSLFLLLRAIYEKLDTAQDKDEAILFQLRKIGKALWVQDAETGFLHKNKPLIHSKVISTEGNQMLNDILEHGSAAAIGKDKYSVNYKCFKKLYEEKAQENIYMIPFVMALINKCILLPVIADSQDTALTIFSTLNARGLPLTDADIFKAELYGQLRGPEAKQFIQDWLRFETDAAKCNESLTSLFTCYMFYLRAGKKELDTPPALRKFFMNSQESDRLQVDGVKTAFEKILQFWKVSVGGETFEDEAWSENMEILKALDILSSYNNEFWKYPVLIYYIEHRDEEDFEVSFLKFLHMLIVALVNRYFEKPTRDAVRAPIIKLNSNIIGNAAPKFENELAGGFIKTNHITEPQSKLGKEIERMILKIIAYNDPGQTDLLPAKWEVEHILPKKWSPIYPDLQDEQDQLDPQVRIDELIEHLGNKMPLEKKKNIRASNNWFKNKKKHYKGSKIAIVSPIANLSDEKTDWLQDDITKRDAAISQELIDLFDEWTAEYVNVL